MGHLLSLSYSNTKIMNMAGERTSHVAAHMTSRHNQNTCPDHFERMKFRAGKPPSPRPSTAALGLRLSVRPSRCCNRKDLRDCNSAPPGGGGHWYFQWCTLLKAIKPLLRKDHRHSWLKWSSNLQYFSCFAHVISHSSRLNHWVSNCLEISTFQIFWVRCIR